MRLRGEKGQALVEYMLMSLMLLFMFTFMYRGLLVNLKRLFQAAGTKILLAYY